MRRKRERQLHPYMEYPTPDNAEAAISALNQCRLILADIFLME